MTRLRDLIRSEPKRGLAPPAWLERILSVGIVASDLTGDVFAFEERGATEIKGIGEARTYFLVGGRAPTQ